MVSSQGGTDPAIPAQARPPGESVLFSIRDLKKIYGTGDNKVHALRGIDLDLLAGEMVVLLGPSGSGKSTLLNILGGLDSATDGQVVFRGQHLEAATPSQLTEYRRAHVGFIFQFYNLIPSLTARENVELVTDIASDPLEVGLALSAVGLAQRAEHFPSQLSGGEQQRVAIARALAKKPDVLLCDEPTGALDLKTGVLTLEALQHANEHFGTTMLIVTHNADIARIAHRVIDFGDGRIRSIRANVERAKPSELSW